MNANCYKVIFSKRLGTLVAVGEHATSSGKAASGQAVRGAIHTIPCLAGIADGFVGVLRFSFASITLACLSLGTTQAQSTLPTIATSTLPQGASVNKGSASITTSGAQMAINQSSDRASINWQSFNVGTGASVNIAQPSASAVLLNRVVGNDPSQILGKLSANGQVILLNPNGILFGKDGSVTASAFTASTFGLSDADFMNGYYKFNRNGSTASVVNQGTIEVSRGGYVALIGATVTNEGQIIAPQGDVIMAAAESVTLPEELVTPKPNTTANTVSVRMSKRVRLELEPAAINAAVSNTESGFIVTEGGQVLLQAAAISAAVASVTHRGNIDTSAPQAGAVTLLAENGSVKVEGSITSNSSGNHNGTSNRGGDIIIGRDEETGALSKATDVSAAKLESNHGFVETSGQHLIVDGVQVKADQWLLDPTDITITSADSGIASTGTNPITLAPSTSGTTASTINTSTLETNLSAGTNVVVRTTNSNDTGNGDITVASNIAVTGSSDATLTLQAERDIVIDSNVNIARTGTNKLNVILNSDLDDNGSGAIKMNSGSSINTNGGGITLGGGAAGDGTGNAIGNATNNSGIALTGATLTAAGGNISLKGRSATTGTTDYASGISIIGSSSITTTGAGDISLTGSSVATSGSQDTGIRIIGTSSSTLATITGGSTGTVSMTGTATIASTSGSYQHGIQLQNVKASTTGGNISLTGTGGTTSGTTAGTGNNRGIAFESAAEVSATGAGTVTLTGVGGTGGPSATSANLGVSFNNTNNIKSESGAISINASAPDNTSYATSVAGNIASSLNGNITVTTDSVSLTGSITAGTGTVTLQNATAGTLISVGGATTDVRAASPKTMAVDSTELTKITAGTTVIGRNDATGSGNVTVNTVNMGALGNTAGNLTVLSGNDITVSGAITKTLGSDSNLNLSAVNGITVSANIGGTLAGVGKLNVSMTANGNAASSANSKGITITKVVDANGGTVSLAGTNRTSAGGNTNSGITLNGATILAQTLTATGIQTGSNTGQNSNGIYFTNSNTLTTSSGVSTITGSSNAIGNFGGGLYLDDNTSLTVNSGAGSIEFSGTNSNIGYRGIRIGSTSNTTLLNATGNISFEDTGFQTFLRGRLTLNSNTTVTLKGKAVQIYGGGIVQKAGGATGTTLNLDAQTVTVGDSAAGSASVTADTINLIGRSTSTGSIDIQILKGSTLTSTGVTTVTTSGLGNTALSSDADTTIAATGGLVVNIGKSGTLRSVITGGTSNAGGLTKQGAGTLSLNNANTMNGTTLVSAGILNLNNVNALQNSTLDTGIYEISPANTYSVAFGVTGSNTYNLGGLQGGDALAIGANGISVGANNSTTTYSGVLSGSGALTKVGTGTTTLTANNTYSGTTTVSGGTLQVGAAGTTGLIGAGAVTLSNNANLNFVRAATTNISNDISGTGNLNATISGSNSDLTLAGTTNITGAIAASATGSILTTGGKNISTTSGVSLAGQNGVAIYSNITNSTSGAVTITAGDNSTTSTAAIVSAAGATITQNAAAAVTMTTDALGDLAVANIVKGAGAGDVTVASGIKLAAGVAGGDIKTVADNAITNNGSGKTLIYTGSSGESGLMSNLHGSLATLYLTANTGQTQNAVTRTAYGAGGGFAGGPSTQVLFREAADITPSVNSATLTKNYGDAAPSTAELITALTAANNGATTSASSTAGTLVASTADVISDIANHVDLNASNNSFSRINANSAGYSYSATGSNYAANGASPNITLIVNKINASVTADSDATKIYNGLAQSLTGFTATGLLSGETESALTGVTVSGSGTNVGTYTTTASGTDTNYNLSFTNGSMVIGKANLSAIGTKVYDASNAFSGNNFSSITGVNGETFTASGSGTLASANVQTNQALSSLGTLSLAGVGGALTSNYNALSTAQTSVNVTPRALSVIGSNTTTTYNGTAQTNSGATITGTQGSDSFTVTGYGTGTNASTSAYADNLSLTAGGSTQLSNYNITYTNAGLTIGKANLTLSGTRTYDGSTTFDGGYLTATGVNSETFTVIGLGDTSNLASKNVQTNQTLSSVTGLSLGTSSNGGLSANYNALTTNASSVSVTTKAASVNATSTTLTYNGALQNQSTPTSSGFVNTDDIVISGLASGKNAATYASHLAVSGNDASNYNVTVVDANLVINQAPLTVTATQVSKTYDSYTSASGTPTVGTLAGSGAGEVINNNGFQTFTTANAGTGKTVQAAGVTIKNASSIDVTSNYDITYVNNTTSEIEKAPLTIKANNDARFVTLNDAAGFNGVSYSGFVGTETNTALGGTLAITRQNALTDVAAGTYTGVLIPSGLTSNNYDISYANGNYTILQANTLLIKTTNQALSYGSTPAFNATAQYLDASNNVIHTLTPSASGNTYLFTDGATGSATFTLKPYTSTGGLAPLSNSGNTVVGVYDVQASNPTIVGNNFNDSPVFIGALTVLPKAVTPSTTNVSKTYDGTTSMNNMDLGLTGKVTGDNLSISGTGAFNQKNAGQGLGYAYSNIVLSGTDVDNYFLSGGTNQFTGTNGVITPAALSLSPSTVSKVYDGTTTATGSLQIVQGTQLFGTDTVSGGTFSFTDPNVGFGNKTVQLRGVSINDDNGGNNYVVTYIDNTLSSITERAATASPQLTPIEIIGTELFTRNYFNLRNQLNETEASNLNPVGLESCISNASSDCVCKVQNSASKEGPVSCSGERQSVSNVMPINSDGSQEIQTPFLN